MRYCCVLLLFWAACFAAPALAQTAAVRGIVRDAQTNEKLPFVSITVNNGETGTTTNLEGSFLVRHHRPINSMRFNYVGYTPLMVKPDSTGVLNISLSPAAAQLQEVVVRAGINPAHRIIALATQNRAHHRTENIPAYTYRTYNKMVLTAIGSRDLDMSDTLSLSKQDSVYLRMRNLLAKRHLFLMESITDFAYLKPNRTQEIILATRVSGLQQPSFGVVAAEARDFSVYEDLPVFFGKRYLSPLSPGSTRKYNFRLQQTTIAGRDTVFIISFKPGAGRNFDGLKGLLYINSDGWAVQNLIAESATDDKRGLKLQQQFKKLNGQLWFPTELDVEMTVKQVQLRGHTLYGRIRTYITNINLNPSLRKSDFGAVALALQPGAARKPVTFWEQHRPDTLAAIEQRTYQRLDSLGKKQQLDLKIRTLEYLLSKQIPAGAISLDINRFMRVSRFEGVRLGMGAHTNHRFSERLGLGGYWGYGLRDGEHKYGAEAVLTLHKPSKLQVAATFFEDVLEPGGRRLPFRESNSLLRELRPVLLSQLDYTTHGSVALSGRVQRYLQVHTSLRREQRRPTFDLPAADRPAPKFDISEGIVGFRYAYGEQLMQLFNQTTPLPNPYPVLWGQFTQGINGLGGGNFTYQKYDLRLEGSVRHRTFGETSATLAGGLVQGKAPFVNLYNGYGSYSSSYNIYVGDGFETMRPYEFFSDRFAALFLKQNLGKRLIRYAFFQPGLVLLHNMGIGDLKQPLPETEMERYSSMRKGFFESGLLFNNIIISRFSGFGAGIFYRYGAYALPETSHNLKIKLTATLAL